MGGHENFGIKRGYNYRMIKITVSITELNNITYLRFILPYLSAEGTDALIRDKKIIKIF